MKSIIFTIVFAIAANAILAQTYNMKIKQGDAATYSATSTVDEITFLDEATTPFVCGDVILYGGETYPTVLIGSQCWFQKNLNIGKRIAGSSEQTEADTDIEKYCYSDLDANCTTYGGLYQWNEAMQYVTAEGTQGICPLGWHIPTEDEFTALITYVGDDGNELKAVGQGTGGGAGTNTSGFSALLAGDRFEDGSFGFLGSYADFWSSNEAGNSALVVDLSRLNSTIDQYTWDKANGFSIRCIKD